MNPMLLVVTVASLVVAAASATIAWQVTRADRQRRAARVAALAAAAGLGAPPAGMSAEVPAGVHDFRPASDDVPAATPVAVSDLFAPPVADSGSDGRQRWLVGAAGVAAAAVIVFVGIGLFGSRAVATVTAPNLPALELVALSHNRAGGALAVAGLVRNSPAGDAVQNLAAEVRVFDAAGILIGTKSAPVVAAALAPGQEASFEVSLGELVTAARYRVSFHAAGSTLPHVDRRTNQPAAVTAEAR